MSDDPHADNPHADETPTGDYDWIDDLADELAFTPGRLALVALIALALFGGLVSIFT